MCEVGVGGHEPAMATPATRLSSTYRAHNLGERSQPPHPPPPPTHPPTLASQPLTTLSSFSCARVPMDS